MKLDILPPRCDLFGERAFLSIFVLRQPTKKKKNLLSELGQPMGRVKYRMGAGCRADFTLLPPAPCHDSDFVAAWLPWPTRLPQPRDPPYLCYPRAAASTWGFGTSCCRASSAGQRLRQLRDRAGSISGIPAAGWGGPLWERALLFPWAGCAH